MTTQFKLKFPARLAKRTTNSSNNPYKIFSTKILFILLILLLLPKFVVCRSSASTKRKRKVAKIYKQLETECETLPEKCGNLIPEESFGCKTKCISLKCHTEIFSKPLEPGEVDFKREKYFESCVKKDLTDEERRKKRERNAARAKN